MEVILYMPAFAFFTLLAIAVASVFRWRLLKKGWPYQYNIPVSVTLLTMWALIAEMPVGIPFFIFVTALVASVSWTITFLAPFLAALAAEEGENGISQASANSDTAY
jgi:hypothetical protein